MSDTSNSSSSSYSRSRHHSRSRYASLNEDDRDQSTQPLHLLVSKDSISFTVELPHKLLPALLNHYQQFNVLSLAEENRSSIIQKIYEEPKMIQLAIPDLIVSAFIGKQGNNIKALNEKNGVDIKVNLNEDQSNNSMAGFAWRVVTIEGDLSGIMPVIEDIQTSLENSRNKLKPGYTSKCTTKFVFPEKAMGYFIGKGGNFVKELNQDHQVSIKVSKSDQTFEDIRRSDSIIFLNGTQNRVIKATQEILERMNEYYRKNHKNFSDYSLKLIISTAHVSKLIGQNGDLVRDIARQSGASQIKILSNKNKKEKECIVKITGNLKNKIEATELIIKYLEAFKSGQSLENQDKQDRKRSRSPQKQKKNKNRSRSRNRRSKSKEISRKNSRKPSLKLSQEKQNQQSKKDEKSLTLLISVKTMNSLVDQNFQLYKKIKNETSTELNFDQKQSDGQLFLQITGTLNGTKNAVGMILDKYHETY